MSDYDLRATANYNHTFADKHIVNLFGGMEIKSIERQRNASEGVGLRYNAGMVPFYVYDYFKRAVEAGIPIIPSFQPIHVALPSIAMPHIVIWENMSSTELYAMKVLTKWDVIRRQDGCLHGTFRALGTCMKRVGSISYHH